MSAVFAAGFASVGAARRAFGRLRAWATSGRGYEYLLAPALTLIILTFALWARGVWPFGDRSVALWDMYYQYVGIFGWLSNVMHGMGSPFYSFSQGMGEGTAALFAYYLASPFNLLAWFFTPEDMPRFMTVLTVLKLCAMSLTGYAFLRRRLGSGLPFVVLGCAYGLCGWAVAECSNIMWLDGAIMLPVVALGTWRLVVSGRPTTLFVGVACAVTFNWYTGYMCCLFSVLYLACLLIARGRAGEARGHAAVTRGSVGGVRGLLVVLVRYAITMLLGLGASLVVFLPAVLGLLATKEGGGSQFADAARLYVMYYPWALPASFVATATPASDWDVMPPVWTSALALVLAVSYLANRTVLVRERVAAGLLLFAMLLAPCVSTLDVVWSALKQVTSYFFRYSFVVSFAVVAVAGEGWVALRGLPSRGARVRLLLASGAFVLAVVAASWAYVAFVRPQSHAAVWGVTLTAVLLLGLPWLAGAAAGGQDGRGGSFPLATGVMVAAVILELGLNTWFVFGHYTRDVNDWGAFVSRQRSELAALAGDGDGVRVANAAYSFDGPNPGSVTTSEGFALGVSGMDEYTSTQGSPMADLLSRLGYTGANETFGYYYNAPMPATDALLGVDYVVAPVGVEVPLAMPVQTMGSGGRAGVAWRSDVAMPAAYGARAGAGDAAWAAVGFDAQALLDDPDFAPLWRGFEPVSDPFANQQAMLADLTGLDASDLYVAPGIDELQDQARAGSRTFRLAVGQDGPLYLSLPLMSTVQLGCTVSVAGRVIGHVGNNFDNSVIYAGSYKAGDVVDMTLTADTTGPRAPAVNARAVPILEGASEGDLLKARSLDEGRLRKLLGALDAHAAHVDTWEDGNVRLSTRTNADETLVTVIPYDRGWTATLDGRDVPVRRISDGLVGIDLPAGAHTVELRYVTPGLAAGAWGSALSLVAFGVWRAVAWRRGAHALASRV